MLRTISKLLIFLLSDMKILVLIRYAIIIMEYVGSKNLHHLLVERREKYLGRAWLLDVAIQVSLLYSLPLVDS